MVLTIRLILLILPVIKHLSTTHQLKLQKIQHLKSIKILISPLILLKAIATSQILKLLTIHSTRVLLISITSAQLMLLATSAQMQLLATNHLFHQTLNLISQRLPKLNMLQAVLLAKRNHLGSMFLNSLQMRMSVS